MDLQKLRVDRGWSQEELSVHSGLSVRTIQRIENGKRASLESLKCLAAVIETSVSSLVKENIMTSTPPSGELFAERAEQEAIDYVQNLKGFHMNWIAFAVIMPCLYFLNMYVSPEDLWVVIVGVAWLFAIALHALVIYGLFSTFGGAWEQRQFEKRMNRHRN